MFATQAILLQSSIEGLDDSKKWDRLMSPDKTEGFEFGTWSMFPNKSGLFSDKSEGKRVYVGEMYYIRYELDLAQKQQCIDYLGSWTENINLRGIKGYIGPNGDSYKTFYYNKLLRLIRSPDVFFYIA